jgi:hypothetical protein
MERLNMQSAKQLAYEDGDKEQRSKKKKIKGTTGQEGA